MMRTIVLLLILAVSGCTDHVESDLQQLAAATTSAQEQQAFEDLWHHADVIEFMPRDNNGIQVPINTDDWWIRVDYIELSVDDHSVQHQLIDSENLLRLMGE